MTTCEPQFTTEELRLIADALTYHIDQIRKLQPYKKGTSNNDTRERVDVRLALVMKVLAIRKQGDTHGAVCADSSADAGRPGDSDAGT